MKIINTKDHVKDQEILNQIYTKNPILAKTIYQKNKVANYLPLKKIPLKILIQLKTKLKTLI